MAAIPTMENAVMKERQATAQQVGRDDSLKLSLLSELKITSPFAFMTRRALYRIESAMGKISNRIYALLATVVFLLVFSAGIFIAGTFLDDNEWDSLRADAGVDGDGVKDGFTATVSYALWLTWCFFVDPGSHTQKLDHTRYRVARVTSALISILGILFFSLVLGFVVDLLASFIARITEGSSTVVEEGHYLILGFSEKCVAVIGELATAMESDGGGVVVVLADSPSKKEFDTMMHAHMNYLGLSNKTRVVFRVGNPLLTANIAKVSPETSRCIILLSDSRMDADHADASVLHMILSLKSLIGTKGTIDRRMQPSDIGAFADFQREPSFYEMPGQVEEEITPGDNGASGVVDESALRPFGANHSRNGRQVLPKLDASPTSRDVTSTTTPQRRGSAFTRLFGSDALNIPRSTDPPPPLSTTPQGHAHVNSAGSHIEYDGVYDDMDPTTGVDLDGNPRMYRHTEQPWYARWITEVFHWLCCRCRICFLGSDPQQEEQDDSDSLSNTSYAELDTKSTKSVKRFKGHVVAELQDNDNRPIIQVSGGSLVELVVIHDIIGRMLAKSVVQPNIRRIYDELLGFDGCEFYFARHPELTGCTFREASLRFQDAVLVGVKRGGDIMLNPDSALPSAVSSRHHHLSSGVLRKSFTIEHGDEVIVIAEDDSSYQVLDVPIYDDDQISGRPWPPVYPLKTALEVVIDKEEDQEKQAALNAVREALEVEKLGAVTPNKQEEGGNADGPDPPLSLTYTSPPYTKLSPQLRRSSSLLEEFMADKAEVPDEEHDDPSGMNDFSLDVDPQKHGISTLVEEEEKHEGEEKDKHAQRRSSSLMSNQSDQSMDLKRRRSSRRSSINSDPDEMDRVRVESMSLESLEVIKRKAEERVEESRRLEAEYISVDPDKFFEEREASMSRDFSSPVTASASPAVSVLSGTSASTGVGHNHKHSDHIRGINVLICGWRRDIKDMLRLMDKCLPRGSSVNIMSDRSREYVQSYIKENCPNLKMDIRHSKGRADIRRRLVEYDALGFKYAENAIDVIVVVTDESKEKDLLMSDSQTIACCLLVRDVQADFLENRDVSLTDLSIPRLEALQVTCPMTCEVLDVATRSTIEENPSIKALAEFIVVNDLAARLIAAIADRREVARVLGELLGSDSQDIFVVESRELLYEDEIVANRAAACVEVGDTPVRTFAEMEYLSGLAAGESVGQDPGTGSGVGGSMNSPSRKKQSFTSRAFRKSSLGASQSGNQENTNHVKRNYVRPVSFAELSKRAAAPPRRGILLGYIKASWNGTGRGELVTIFNPKAKSAPLYWHTRDFLIVMSLEEQSDPRRVGHRLTVVR